jgi:hypothetical protein
MVLAPGLDEEAVRDSAPEPLAVAVRDADEDVPAVEAAPESVADQDQV